MGLSQSGSFGSGIYLAQKDVEPPIRVTIKDVRMETLKNDEGDQEKPVAHFKEPVKPMVVNRTNFLAIDEIAGGHDDTDRWIGMEVELYCDPGVMYGTKRVGGIRARKPNGGNGALISFEDAIKLAQEYNKTRDDLVAMLKSKGATAYNAKDHTALVRAWIADISIPF